MAEELRRRYDRETDIRYAAARLWIDAIIDPARTREVLIHGVRRRDAVSRAEPDHDGGVSGLSGLS